MTNISETQKQILESDDFVLSETKKIQYAYRLKHETRYNIERKEEVSSESVAEHIYALHILADYFLPLEDPDNEMDWAKVHNMVQYHDIDEIETGDKIGYLKTDAERKAEIKAMERVIKELPDHMQNDILSDVHEYEELETREATFTKALDRVEPLFQLYNQNGRKISEIQLITKEQSSGLKEEYTKPYPYIYRFYRVIEETMEKEGFFYES